MAKLLTLVNGYVLRYVPELNSCSGWLNHVYEHILVAEKSLGRSLRGAEVVHHLNRIRSDNRPMNLLVVSNAQHNKIHRWLDRTKIKSYSDKYLERPKKIPRCFSCKWPMNRAKNTFCSLACKDLMRDRFPLTGKPKLEKKAKQRLVKLIESGMPWVRIGEKLCVSDNGARKMAKRIGYNPKTRKLN